MVNLKIKLPDSFLEEEVRDGYLVTRKMKAVWAVELDLLAEAIRVLEKYSIKYFAIGGTLLGAVRHKGFIPWDDDIDIALPRVEYEKFRSVANKEFTHPYFFQDEFNSPGLLCGHAKLRNTETTMVTSNHMDEKVGKLSFNMGIFIDFFPVDNIPDDDKELSNWKKELDIIARKAWHLRMYTHRGRIISGKENKYKFQKFLINSVFHCPNYFFKKYENHLSKYANMETLEGCLYCVYCREHSGKHRFLWKNKDLNLNTLEKRQFEFLDLPCPQNYDAILTQSYGNWREKVQAKSQHGYSSSSFYDVDNSYLTYFDKFGYLDRKKVIDYNNNN